MSPASIPSPAAPEPHGARFVALLLPETGPILRQPGYYSSMIEGLNAGLMERHVFMRPVQCLHEYQKEHFLHGHMHMYSGVAILGTLFSAELFVRAVVENVPGPKVMLDHHVPDLGIHSVTEDSEAGMRLLAGHLLSLGHRRLAYLDHAVPEANPWKRAGIDAALNAAGLPGLGRGWTAGCRDQFSDAATALDWFLGLSPRPTAILCFNDSRALLLLQAAAERGLRVPQDLSIAGYGDVAVRTGRSASLTSVWVDPALIGRRAAELLTAAPAGPPALVRVPPELMARGTTAPPPPGLA
ncbi:MAG TPA: substrate-binding domain-containing protein [Planctomycetota bacterium]|nr:substrate-binding domain-containing protein [Planctomycetota bacterium]